LTATFSSEGTICKRTGEECDRGQCLRFLCKIHALIPYLLTSASVASLLLLGSKVEHSLVSTVNVYVRLTRVLDTESAYPNVYVKNATDPSVLLSRNGMELTAISSAARGLSAVLHSGEYELDEFCDVAIHLLQHLFAQTQRGCEDMIQHRSGDDICHQCR
jgi:hypothetical protein